MCGLVWAAGCTAIVLGQSMNASLWAASGSTPCIKTVTRVPTWLDPGVLKNKHSTHTGVSRDYIKKNQKKNTFIGLKRLYQKCICLLDQDCDTCALLQCQDTMSRDYQKYMCLLEASQEAQIGLLNLGYIEHVYAVPYLILESRVSLVCVLCTYMCLLYTYVCCIYTYVILNMYMLYPTSVSRGRVHVYYWRN